MAFLVKGEDIVGATIKINEGYSKEETDELLDEKADQESVTNLSIKVPFKFGIDENGNYGYYKDGADSVTPFSKAEIISNLFTPDTNKCTMIQNNIKINNYIFLNTKVTYKGESSSGNEWSIGTIENPFYMEDFESVVIGAASTSSSSNTAIRIRNNSKWILVSYIGTNSSFYIVGYIKIKEV